MPESNPLRPLGLPPELGEFVLKNLQDDLPTLRNLSAVCRALAAACRPYKWRVLYIDAMRVHQPQPVSVCIRLHQIIDPEIKLLVKELMIDDREPGISIGSGDSTPSFVLKLADDLFLPRTIQMFPNLTTLHLCSLKWVDTVTLAPAIRNVLSRVTDVAFVEMRFPLSTIFWCRAMENLFLYSVTFFEPGEESKDDDDDGDDDVMDSEDSANNDGLADEMDIDYASTSMEDHDKLQIPDETAHLANARPCLVSFHLLGDVGKRANTIWTYFDFSRLKTLGFSVPLEQPSVASFNHTFQTRGYGSTVETLELECSEYLMDGQSYADEAAYTGGYPDFNHLSAVRHVLITIPTWYPVWLTVLQTLLSRLNQGACAVVETITVVMLLDQPGSLVISGAHPTASWQGLDAEIANVSSSRLTEVVFKVHTDEGDESDIIGLDVVWNGMQGLQAQGLLKVETTAELPFDN